MRRRLVLLVLPFLLAGCGSEGASSAEGGTTPELLGTGKVADYAFQGTRLDGSTFDGRSLAGRAAVLWFWAPWCPTCRAQSPTVAEVAEQYDGRVAVVGVGGLDSAADIEDLAARIPHVDHVVDPDGEVWQHFGVTAQSSYAVIAADGELLVEGYLDNAELVDLMGRLAGSAGEDS